MSKEKTKAAAGITADSTVAETTTTVAPVAATLGPQGKGDHVFGVAHIFASFNDTFIHVTDLSGRETLVRVTGLCY